MTEHTPGPWATNIRPSYSPQVIAKRGSTFKQCIGIADCFDERDMMNAIQEDRIHSREEADANAQLIAAAPDLLRALKAMVNHFGVLEDNELVHKTARSATKKAKAAIAKAQPPTKPSKSR